jgi:hypothetical protein
MKQFLIAAILVCFAQIGHAQSDKRQPELFTSYFSVSTPVSKAHIPADICLAIIGYADRLVGAPGGLKALGGHELQIASVNLRVCATSKDLARTNRDLAVGLYGEIVSEIERREEGAR